MQAYWNLEVKDKIGVLTYVFPPKNFFNFESMKQLGEILTQIEHSDDVRVVIVRSGIPGVFISGADVNIFDGAGNEGIMVFIEESRTVLRKMETLSKPVIAMIEGVCLGGGNEFALCCDIRIAGQSSTFGQPEIIYGLIPGGGGTQRITRLTSKSRAMKLMLTGFTISPDEAFTLGLVDEVVPDDKVYVTAMKYAKRIAGQSPLAVSTIKEVILKGEELSFDESLELELEGFKRMLESDDLREGLNAFKERRRPNYTGK